MFDERTGGAGAIDFQEFADQLLEQGQQASPSSVHGCLCGLLAAGGSGEPEWGLARLCEALDLSLHGELAGSVLQLYQSLDAALEDEEFDFHPLLPDDSADMDQRTLSLAAWCSGFLSGYALPDPPARAGAAGDSAEILRDFAAIAEVELDREAPEEESEESFMELVEYLRFAVLNVYLDNRIAAGSDQAGSPGVLH